MSLFQNIRKYMATSIDIYVNVVNVDMHISVLISELISRHLETIVLLNQILGWTELASISFT